MENSTQIKCPECGSNIDVNDLLKHQIEDTIRKELQHEHAQSLLDFQRKADLLKKEQEKFKNEKERESEIFNQRLEKEKKEAEKRIAEKLKTKLEGEQKEAFAEMNKELSEKTEKLKELYKKDAEIAKLQREKLEIKDLAEAEAQKQLNDLLLAERDKVRKQEEDKNELKFKELQKQLEDQKKLTQEMKRKQEQGSMQLQGEVQELAMEEWLVANFPLDTIDEVKKGANGADCLQTVHTREFQNCGTIYYESKNTKNFSVSWIDKFKNDIKEKNANIGVLVTNVLPKEIDRATMIEKNLWVCTYQEFKSLSMALRQSLVLVSQVTMTQVNKGDKMELLYDYLTSNEFRLQFGAIKDSFIQMQSDLDSEIRVTQTRWNRRKKEIDKVMGNVTGIYGSLRGIAGNSIARIGELEDENLLNQ